MVIGQSQPASVALAADQPGRHRTLQAAIGWSYDLLDERSRAFFDRMSVFVDGWDQESAAGVADIPVEDALPVLAALTKKHVIRSTEQVIDGEPRFSLLAEIATLRGALGMLLPGLPRIRVGLTPADDHWPAGADDLRDGADAGHDLARPVMTLIPATVCAVAAFVAYGRMQLAPLRGRRS
jgi:hypothetical protein